MWSFFFQFDSYSNIARHQFIISCGVYIYGQGDGIHLSLPIRIEIMLRIEQLCVYGPSRPFKAKKK